MTATPSLGWTTVTIDCADAEALGAFYSRGSSSQQAAPRPSTNPLIVTELVSA
jgi:hypothetical protein